MHDRRARSGCIVLALALAAVAGCKARDDQRSIKAAPEQAAPVATAPVATPTASPSPPVAVPVANPLAMPLKHDGHGPTPKLAAVDPCARPDPRGPLAMRLKHDGAGRPHQPNPLCMRLK